MIRTIADAAAFRTYEPDLRTVHAVLVATALALGGCRAHVVIDELPPPTAPLLERAEAYEEVKPSELGGPGAVVTQWGPIANQTMLLANGGLIFEAIELSPAVDVDSKTMLHARKADELSTTGQWLFGSGVAIGVLGIAGELVGGAMVLASPPGPNAPIDPIANAGFVVAIGSALVGVAGLLALGVPSIFVTQFAQEEKAAAFLAYEPDLRARLALVPKKIDPSTKWESP